jgi:hypothetical protein
MLAELRNSHDELLARVDQFEEVVRAARPDLVAVAQVRLKLTQASSARRALLERIYPALEPLAPDDAERVRQLRAEGVTILMAASRFIATWTMQQIENDWQGYQRASAIVRHAMRKRVEQERQLLYPLLARQQGGQTQAMARAS